MAATINQASRWLTSLFVITTLISALLALMAWYWASYSMDVARSYEAAGAPNGGQVLIATQGSAFKNAVTGGLMEHLRRRSAHVKVIDVSGLKAIQPADWDAVVVIHTWEMGEPPAEVRAFVGMSTTDKLVVLTTSGAGDFKLQGVDAISSASRMADVPARVADITWKLDRILDSRSMTK